MVPPDLLTDQPARQTRRRQPRDLFVLPFRQPFHNTPPDRSNSIEGADALTP